MDLNVTNITLRLSPNDNIGTLTHSLSLSVCHTKRYGIWVKVAVVIGEDCSGEKISHK